MEKQKCPEIRFTKFNENWSINSLGDLMNVGSVKRVHQADWCDAGVRFLRARDIVAFAKNEDIADPIYISQDRYEQYSNLSGKVMIGDLLVTGVGTIGVPMLVKNDDPLYFKDGNVIWFKNENTIDGLFLYYSFTTKTIQNFINDSAGIGTVGTYTITSGKQTPIYLPKKNEQIQIGLFFQDLDKSIALHEKKLAQTQNFKKAMLEKMFPTLGSNRPEIRLKGFSGDWDQHELGEHSEMFNGDRGVNYPTSDDMVKVGIPFINAGDLEDGRVNLQNANKITRYKYNQLNGAKIKFGDIVYCLRGTLGKNAFIDNFNEGTVASSLVVIRPKNILGVYLFQVLNTDIEYRQRTLCDEGAAQPNLSAKNLAGFMIPVPSIEEQKAIGYFFNKLDETLNLQQQQLQTLKNLKQALLEKMFV